MGSGGWSHGIDRDPQSRPVVRISVFSILGAEGEKIYNYPAGVTADGIDSGGRRQLVGKSI